jgi:hypothetical protein
MQYENKDKEQNNSKNILRILSGSKSFIHLNVSDLKRYLFKLMQSKNMTAI